MSIGLMNSLKIHFKMDHIKQCGAGLLCQFAL